jgi:hypothetical protein
MKKIFILFSALLTIAACSSNDSNETGIEGNNYNRTVLLTNWADIIIPSYVNYQAKIEVLAANITTFNSVTTSKSSSGKNIMD